MAIDKNSQSHEQELLKEKAKDSKNTKNYNDIISTVLHEGETMFGLQNKTVFLSSIIAGLEIGFSYLLICTLYSFWIGTLPDGTIFKLFSIVYPVGFIMVIVVKSALFTEQTSIVALPVLNGQRSIMRVDGIIMN